MLTRVNTSDRQNLARRSGKHAIVIGSGFGGLAAAIRLGARGYRVTVLEKLATPGGRAQVYHQDGFTFDAGPTIITAPFLFEDLWALCGRKLSDDVELREMDPFYDIRFNDGTVFRCWRDDAKMLQEIRRIAPEDEAGYLAYMKKSKAIFEVGFEELGHVPFNSWLDMAKVAPDLARHQCWRSVYSLVSKYISNEKLRTVLSFHPLLIGGNPFSASAVYCLICYLERKWGVHFAMGGTGALVTGLVDLIHGQGNQVVCNAQVDEIIVENGGASGVVLKSGERVKADIVVSNADAAWTYEKLLPANYRRRWTDRRLAKARYSMGLFVWYFGTDRRFENVPHHSILLGPRYRELLSEIFSGQGLPRDFSIYLHRPTATDPTLAPEGCDAFYALAPVPHLNDEVNWQASREPFRQALEARLIDTVLPDLAGRVVSSRTVTPEDFLDRYCSVNGAGFSLEPILTQSAWFRPHNISEEINGLYLVGAGTHPGAGVPGVLSSARILDEVVPHGYG